MKINKNHHPKSPITKWLSGSWLSSSLLILFLAPISANAQIIISEIMYNPEGTDTGREWIEVYNSGSTEIDLSTYKFLESEVNHKISAFEESNSILSAGNYAIIADKPENFLIDFSSYDGILLDSAFSLNNSGESLTIINPEGSETDSFSYSPELGANGNGNSLQLNDGIFIQADPTPGTENAKEAEIIDEPDSGGTDTGSGSGSSNNSDSSNSTHSSQSELSDYKPKIELKVYSGRDRTVTLNSKIDFKIEHNQDSDSKIESIWTFGDGESKKGREVSYSYKNPGQYNLVLNARKDDEQAVSRSKITVLNPEIEILLNQEGLNFKNNSKNEINIGEFQVKTPENSFRFPEDTIISAGKTIILNKDVFKGEFSENSSVYYPNGKIFWESGIKKQYSVLYENVPPEKHHQLTEILLRIEP